MKVVSSLIVLLIGSLGFAQGLQDNRAVNMTRMELQAKRQQIVEQAMDLTEQQQKLFGPLYRDWRAKSAGLGDRRLALIQRVDAAGSVAEAEAKVLIDEWAKLQKDALAVKLDYLKRFRKILPDSKVARFFQLEGKLDAIIDYDLVSRVPLLD